jgi:Lon protease-like protein
VVTQLPLFPLTAVLFPGLVLPLHVFERRYRVLIQALLSLPEGAERLFGIIAIRSGREVGSDGVRALHGIGCTARLHDVTSLPDGRFDIVVVGDTRFRLTALDQHAGTPYSTGLVELLGEPGGDADAGEFAALAGAVRAGFCGYRKRLGLDPVPMPDDPTVLSYLIAAGVLLDLTDRQSLLEAQTTAERLGAELGLLRREAALIEAFSAVPAVDLTSQAGSPN